MRRLTMMATMLAAVMSAASATAMAQSNLGPQFSVLQIQSFEPLGQSFTAEYASLLEIGFAFGTLNAQFAAVPVTIDLYLGAGAGGTFIAQRSINPTPTASGLEAEFAYADFSGITLDVGEVYTAWLSTTNSYWGVGGTQDLYAGGQVYLGVPSGSGTEDLMFDVRSKVELSEPHPLLLLAPGVLLLAAARRRAASSPLH
ncbi:MAG: hypothetical protein IBJ19_01320 [Gemmatimonadaceae bacterium]|nr:hypothetical protein [Gemmatimonadaceae bacterium]